MVFTPDMCPGVSACRHGFDITSSSASYLVTCATGRECRAWKTAWKAVLNNFHGRDGHSALIETEAAAGVYCTPVACKPPGVILRFG